MISMDSSTGRNPEYSAEEQQLADYLDEVISEVLARKALEPHGRLTGPAKPQRSAPLVRQSESIEVPVPTDRQIDDAFDELGVIAPADSESPIECIAPSARPANHQHREPTPARPDDSTVGGQQQASSYLRRFLEQSSAPIALTPTGIAELDRLLLGGLGYGLHVIAGPSGVGKTAFLEGMLWEATSSGNPVVYYVLKEGPPATWMRLISTLGAVLGDSAVSLAEMRDHSLRAGSMEALHRLDRQLQESVLPLVALVGTIPAHADVIGAFLRDLVERTNTVRAERTRTPLIMLDDLDLLLRLAGDPPPFATLSRLDEALRASSLAIVASTSGGFAAGIEPSQWPVQTVIELNPAGGGARGVLRSLVLLVTVNVRTGATGGLQAVLDTSSGLLAC